MKIGFDAKRAFLNNTGLGNYSRDTIRILGSFYPKNEYHLYTPKITKNDRLNFLEKNNQYKVHAPTNFLNKTLSGIWRSVKLTKELTKHKIELYHGLSHELPYNIEKSNIKTIVTIHDLIFIRYPELFKKTDRKIYHYKFLNACRVADHIIAVSEQTKEDIINYFNIPKKKITVIYQGCNPIFQASLNHNTIFKKYNLPKKYLLSVGNIEKRKNLMTILKSMCELTNQHLVVIGNGKKYKKECQKFIKANSLDHRIHFLKDLNLNEIAEVYKFADIMIYPSLFEGFGIPILEALFSKIPVITSKGGCFHESGGPSSLYINPLDHSEITNAVQKIQKKTEIRQSMIESGYKHAQNFKDDIIAKNLMKVYKSLFNK